MRVAVFANITELAEQPTLGGNRGDLKTFIADGERSGGGPQGVQ